VAICRKTPSQLHLCVADKHSHVTDQSTFDLWRRTLELDKPDVFLKKLASAIDQLVKGKWWVDRKEIRAKLDNENTGCLRNIGISMHTQSFNKRHGILTTFYRRFITMKL
jgi:hypothetical protein